jgi:hypothetical protein
MPPSMEQTLYVSDLIDKMKEEVDGNPPDEFEIVRFEDEDGFGYRFEHRYKVPVNVIGYFAEDKRKKIPFSVRAREFDGIYLLEERLDGLILSDINGEESSENFDHRNFPSHRLKKSPFELFGIEKLSQREKVEGRLIDKIRPMAIEYIQSHDVLKHIPLTE